METYNFKNDPEHCQHGNPVPQTYKEREGGVYTEPYGDDAIVRRDTYMVLTHVVCLSCGSVFRVGRGTLHV